MVSVGTTNEAMVQRQPPLHLCVRVSASGHLRLAVLGNDQLAHLRGSQRLRHKGDPSTHAL